MTPSKPDCPSPLEIPVNNCILEEKAINLDFLTLLEVYCPFSSYFLELTHSPGFITSLV